MHVWLVHTFDVVTPCKTKEDAIAYIKSVFGEGIYYDEGTDWILGRDFSAYWIRIYER